MSSPASLSFLYLPYSIPLSSISSLDFLSSSISLHFDRCLLDSLSLKNSNAAQILVDLLLTPTAVILLNPRLCDDEFTRDYSPSSISLPVGSLISSIFLRHALTCPARARRNLEISPKEILNKNIRLAVCVLLSDSAGRIYLTRRPAAMRTFSRCWVCPGGSVDSLESAPQAAARELFEEIGIQVSLSDLQPLGLWESMFPSRVELGPLISHHLIIFFHCRISEQNSFEFPSEKIPQPKIPFELQPSEVDRIAAIYPADLISINSGDPKIVTEEFCDSSIPVIERSSDGHCWSTIRLEEFGGIYPFGLKSKVESKTDRIDEKNVNEIQSQSDQQNTGSGIGEAHLWAVRLFNSISKK